MASEMDRRDFLASTPAAMFLAGTHDQSATAVADSGRSVAKIEPFDYQGVRLRPSRWQQQVAAGRDYYFVSDRCRHPARLPQRGRAARDHAQPLGGWCGVNSNSILGQWLSGMARLAARHRRRATCSTRPTRPVRSSWRRTVTPDGDARHASLSIRQARRRPRRPAQYAGVTAAATDARARGCAFCLEDIRLARKAAAGRSDSQPSLLRGAAGVVHALGEPLSGPSSDLRPEVQGVRRGVALRGVLGQQVREAPLSTRRSWRARL